MNKYIKKIFILTAILLITFSTVVLASTVPYLSNMVKINLTISSPVVINEIGYRGAPEEEFVELYNLSSDPINLNGWKIQDNKEEDVLISFEEGGSTIIPAGGYAVITANETNVVVPEGVIHLSTGDKRIGNGLADGDDIVILKSPDGKIMDQKGYSQNPCEGGEKYSYQKMNGDWECKVPSPGASNI